MHKTETYAAVIIWQGAEIGFGQGETARFARAEAIESVPSVFRSVRAEWNITVRRELDAD